MSGLEWPLVLRADFVCRYQEKGDDSQLQDNLLTKQASQSVLVQGRWLRPWQVSSGLVLCSQQRWSVPIQKIGGAAPRGSS